MSLPNYFAYGVERVPESDDRIERILELDDREEFDPLVTPDLLAEKIQNVVDSIISSCDDVDWSEDLISFNIVKELREVLAYYKLPRMLNMEPENKFNFEAYKLTGKAEQTHGDIAFVISRKIYGSKPVSGVAFYEAKASGIGYKSDMYPSFNIQQLRRLVTHTPKLSYLLYNRKSRRVVNDKWPIFTSDSKGYENQVHAITIDANFLKQYRSISEASMAFGQSFGYHFVQRVLSGRDLDYSRPVDETIRRWLKHTKRSAPLIISVSVFEEKEEHFSTQLELPGYEVVKFPEVSYKKYVQINRKYDKT